MKNLSLKYIIGLHVAGSYPVSFISIKNWVADQYIGAYSDDLIRIELQEMINDGWITYYDGDENLYAPVANTSVIIERGVNKYQD